MTDERCRLCDLPLDAAVGSRGPSGYCCRGCAAIDERLEDVEATEPTDGSPIDDAGAVLHCTVDGMHCTACERFLEHRATAVEGVSASAANYTTGTVAVGYDPAAVDDADVRDALSVAGYDATDDPDDAGDRGRSSATRLLVGGFFAMMAMVWYALFLYPHYLGVPTEALLLDPAGDAGTYLFLNLAVAAGVVVFYTGAPILRGAVVGLRAGVPNADLLLAIAVLAAYGFSLGSLLIGRTEVYFDVAVAVVMAVTLGDHYRQRIASAATDRLDAIAAAGTDTVRVVTADGVDERPVDAVAADDVYRLEPGDTVPVDGRIEEGLVAVDESLLTGDRTPVTRRAGDVVVGGTTVVDGEGARVAVEGEPHSTLDAVTSTLWRADAASGGTARAVDRLAAVFVPTVLLLAGLATGWTLLGGSAVAAMLTGIAVLVVSCPCALGIATPMAVAAGVRRALDDEVVVVGDGVFAVDDVDVAVLDKTGTLSRGDLAVTDASWREDVEEERAAAMAAAVAGASDHPVSRAIADRYGSADAAAGGVEEIPGAGVVGDVEGRRVAVGDGELFGEEGWTVPSRLERTRELHAEDGAPAAYVGIDGRAVGVVALDERPRSDWHETVAALADRVGRVVIVTGDPAEDAGRFGAHPGVDEAYTDVRPEGKAALLERLGGDATTMMVGDGDNDGPALAAADVGVAVGRSSALAADGADVVVLDDDLAPIPRFLDTLSATRRRIRENLGWALLYNAVGLPLAVVGALTPLAAAAAMTASSLLVVGNSVRDLSDG